jgi:hypothetical protein
MAESRNMETCSLKLLLRKDSQLRSCLKLFLHSQWGCTFSIPACRCSGSCVERKSTGNNINQFISCAHSLYIYIYTHAVICHLFQVQVPFSFIFACLFYSEPLWRLFCSAWFSPAVIPADCRVMTRNQTAARNLSGNYEEGKLEDSHRRSRQCDLLGGGREAAMSTSLH